MQNAYHILGGELPEPAGVPSLCGVIMGGPQPYRGLAAGVIEVVAALFFPKTLRIVVGTIGVLRIAYGMAKISGTNPRALAWILEP